MLWYSKPKKTLSLEFGVSSMTTKTASTTLAGGEQRSVAKLVKLMTAAAWIIFGIGLLLSLLNMNHFSDQNQLLMIGIGCMVGSVHIYVIRTAIHLVHSRTGMGAEQARI